MGHLRDRLEMLKQMRWREAHQATGAEQDAATDRLIRLHSAITAIEASIFEGVPTGVSDLDVDGHGLTRVGMSLAQANSDAYERYQTLEKDSGSVAPAR
jgi:hypothetical protein